MVVAAGGAGLAFGWSWLGRQEFRSFVVQTVSGVVRTLAVLLLLFGLF